ncbi:NUDIX domain-containing protein [Haloarcula sp. CBA1130]|uniref:NUDIX domain-containing protein n=1 Tax=unclassified Haloarcula TaxID=2624677 RepID=UPI00124731D3|nr:MULTISPECIES: NUDIX domain-containing protein [unclassified Haloarcula]KAA9399779.1 NUDIX domain-containing protein [Haloarcula sp. CBA1129]KAA9401474.1 NUDIX domain-containing protein [Haloarcula sp. CBA1130]
METRSVVTCFLRSEGEVLLLRRSDSVGSYRDQWGGVAGHVTDDAGQVRDPETAARAEIDEETGLADAVTLVRQGDSFQFDDADRGIRWAVHPFLFDCEARTVETNEETAETVWVHPPAILTRETVPRLWTAWDRVRPRVATVQENRTHGSAWLSLRALEILRDEAALANAGRSDGAETAERDGDDWNALAALAAQLRKARPSMVVVTNRINRAMAAVTDESPAAVERAATETLNHAVTADRVAAAVAAEHVGDRLATLSRSGTVRAVIDAVAPAAVLVSESRPGGEGVGVAEAFADSVAVTLTTDAAFGHELDAWSADTLVVGADRVLPDGRVVNKVGTRSAALSAAAAGVDCYAVCATDKIAPHATWEREERDPRELYDGDADIAVSNPTFDVTPASTVTVVTERGVLGRDDIEKIADAHRDRSEWIAGG